MSRKQEYIARIKYSNTLPAPLVAPKLLKYPINQDEEVDSPQLITSLYTKTNVTPLININNDLAMPMDLMQLPGLLNKNDTTFLYGLENVKLSHKDRVLLRDPRVDKNVETDTSKVTFLRRTEYLSSTISASSGTPSHSGAHKRSRQDVDDDSERILNPPEIVTKVESTFDTMSHDLSSFRHPTKRNLKAVKTWDLLPDTASMDQNYFTLRLVGSAALDNRERKKLALDTTIFRPVELEEDEWISMYTTDKNDSKLLSENIEKVIEEDVEKNVDDDKKVFKFKRLRDFDMKQVANMPVNTNTVNAFGEVAIVFNNDKKIAYYKPLRSRIELRRRRVNDVFRSLVKEHNIDQLNIKLRNPTTKEANVRDRLRMKFDPINFVPVDEDEDGHEDAEEQEAEDDSNTKDETDNKDSQINESSVDDTETATNI